MSVKDLHLSKISGRSSNNLTFTGIICTGMKPAGWQRVTAMHAHTEEDLWSSSVWSSVHLAAGWEGRIGRLLPGVLHVAVHARDKQCHGCGRRPLGQVPHIAIVATWICYRIGLRLHRWRHGLPNTCTRIRTSQMGRLLLSGYQCGQQADEAEAAERMHLPESCFVL